MRKTDVSNRMERFKKFDYTKRNKLTDHTELVKEKE